MKIPAKIEGPRQNSIGGRAAVIDLRSSIWLPWGRYYVTIIAGRER